MATNRQNWDDGVCYTALSLWVAGKTSIEIRELYGIGLKTLNNIKYKALNRGWIPGNLVLLEYVIRAP